MKVRNFEIRFNMIAALVLLLSFQINAAEQVLDDQEILNIENLYKPAPSTRKTEAKPVEETSNSIPATESSNNLNELMPTPVEDAKPEVVQKPDIKFDRLTDLNQLAPFREISVIQKKYLPKTERFQAFLGAGLTTNSPWFMNLGIKANLAYHFTESFGVELSGIFLSNSERQVAKEIRDNNNLQPEKFVNTKSYIGADLVWVPIYGKLSLLNNRIIPFDMYFSAGGGSSNTTSQEGNVPTLHAGVGQIFAINKSMAFRWDYSWTTFQATPVADANASANSKPSKNSYNDLILTAGFSFFFPEAKYR